MGAVTMGSTDNILVFGTLFEAHDSRRVLKILI